MLAAFHCRSAGKSFLSGIDHGDAGVALLDARDAGRREQLDAASFLHAFEQRKVDVGPVDHRVRIAEAGAKRFADRDAADQRFVDGVVHHHLVGVDGATARPGADAEGVECSERIRSELDAGADLADLGRLLEHLDGKALARKGQCGGEAADAAAGHEHRARQGCCVHGCAVQMLVSMSGCRGERHRRAHRSMRRPATGLP